MHLQQLCQSYLLKYSIKKTYKDKVMEPSPKNEGLTDLEFQRDNLLILPFKYILLNPFMLQYDP